MDKALKGAGIGFLVGGGLVFVVATLASGTSENEDVANFAVLYGVNYGLLASVIGGMIGLVIGGVLERRVGDGSYRSPGHCQDCGSPAWGNPKTCRYCGARLDSL